MPGLAELHTLSEQLDTLMARALPGAITSAAYAQARRAVGRGSDHIRQIDLTLDIGPSLERYMRNPLLPQTPRLMRAPADTAGLWQLQRFLEQGFDSFRSMQGADAFLRAAAQRERNLARVLFAAGDEGLPALAALDP